MISEQTSNRKKLQYWKNLFSGIAVAHELGYLTTQLHVLLKQVEVEGEAHREQ